MITAQELEQLRRRVERLQDELNDTRRQLEAWERREQEARAVATVRVEEAEAVKLEAKEAVEAGADAGDGVPPKQEALPPPLPPLPPRAVVKAVATAPATAAEPSALRVWLERLQLWPPAAGEEGSAEARLGAWWATRVGTLLAVVGVVFFAMYVSRHTPAWVKFAELLAVAAAVSAAGRWIARRLPAFGEVVFAGGLSLFFFSAYAGHALPAVRVFPELWMSVAAQTLAVGGIVGAALWRRSAMIATLAIGLGFVTAVVSGRGGMDGYALGAAALLAVVAVGLRRWRGWEGPSVLALPGAYGVFALGLLKADALGAPELSAATWPFLAGMAALFFARDWRGEEREVSRQEVWFQSTNSSLASLCGLAAALGWGRADLEWFYLGAAGLFATGAWLRSRWTVKCDPVAAVLIAKATGALTLAVIEIAGARDAAVALLVQAWVLAWLARRLSSGVLAAGTGLVAAVATWFFFVHGLEAAPLWSAASARAAGFALGLALLTTEAGRWLLPVREARGLVEAAGAAVASLGLVLAVARVTPTGWTPSLLLGLAGVFAGASLWRGGRACGWAATVLAAVAQVSLWAMAARNVEPTLAWNAGLVLGGTVLAGALLKRSGQAVCAWAAAGVGAVLSAFALWRPEVAMVASAALALVAGGLAVVVARRHLPWIATLVLGLGVACWTGRGLPADAVAWVACAALLAWALPVGLRAWARASAAREAEPLAETMERLQVLAATVLGLRALEAGLDAGELGLGLAGAALVVFGLAARLGLRPGLVASWVFWLACAISVRGGEPWAWSVAALLAWAPAWAWARFFAAGRTGSFAERNFAGGQVVVASVVGLVVAQVAFAGAAEIFALTGLVATAALARRPGGVRAAGIATGLLATWLGLAALGEVVNGRVEGGFFAAVLGAALVLAAAPLWLRGERVLRYAGGGAGMALAFALFAAQPGWMADYATVGWGLAAIGVFMAGLFLRVVEYRVLGLLGLALCVPRVFFVDLNSTLHRIVAFIALGLVLLWVGFSYHRFKHLVSGAKAPSDSSKA